LINKDIHVECFRLCLSLFGHRISPLSKKYKQPQQPLFYQLYNLFL